MTNKGKTHPNRELVDRRADDLASEDMDFPDVIVLDGWDECILGTVDFHDAFKVVYSRRKILLGLMGDDQSDMSYEEAVEYMSFNIEGLYAGEYTPIILDDEYFE